MNKLTALIFSMCCMIFHANSQHKTFVVTQKNGVSGIQQAIYEAKKFLNKTHNGTAIIKLQSGKYSFEKTVEVSNVKKGTLIIEGTTKEQTLIEFSGFQGIGFDIKKSNTIEIRKMHVSRKELYACQGKLLEHNTNQKWVKFRLDSGFKDPQWLTNQIAAQDNDRTMLPYAFKNGSYQLQHYVNKLKIQKVNKLSGKDYKIYYRLRDGQNNRIPIGTTIAIKSKIGNNNLLFNSVNRIKIADVHVSRSPAVAIKLKGNNNTFHINNVSVGIHPSDANLYPIYSNLAGGIMNNSYGKGSIIENCVISNTADDGIGFYPSNPASPPTGGIIRNNIIHDNHGRGIVIRESRGVTIENNTIYRNRGEALLIKQDIKPFGSANTATRNLTVKNNFFGKNFISAVIGIDTDTNQSQKHTRIHIHNNEFNGVPKNNPILRVNHATRVKFYNNRIRSHFNGNDSSTDINIGANYYVWVQNASFVTGTNNIISRVS